MSALRAGCGLLFLALCLAAGQAGAADGLWLTDFEAAKAKAAKENKQLLLDFTGSDWCSWCQRLSEEVFSQPAFKAEAPKSFVLVELDFPNEKQLDPKLKAQNEKLKEQYQVEGYPTVFLATPDGKPFARTGYQAGGAERYLAHLKAMLDGKSKVDQLVTQAGQAAGPAKAKLLDEAVELSSSLSLVQPTAEWAAQIQALDADGAAGLKAKYQFKARLQGIEAKLAEDHDSDRALVELESLLKQEKLPLPSKQAALHLQANLYLEAKGEKLKALELLEQAEQVLPDSPLAKEMSEMLAGLREFKAAKLRFDLMRTQAQKLEGVAKAKLLDQCVDVAESAGMAEVIDELAEQIKELDKDNGSGLKYKYEMREKLRDIERDLFQTRDMDKAAQGLLAYLKLEKIPGPYRQSAFYMLGRLAQNKRDMAGALSFYTQAQQAAPETKLGKQLAQVLSQVQKKE